MNLGFYYHVPVNVKGKTLTLPGYIGLFIDSLALRVDKLFLIVHSTASPGDYVLKAKNLVLIDLGVKSSALIRSLNSRKILSQVDPHIPNMDILLVRAPSPLAPAFTSYKTRVIYYLVGDYAVSATLIEGYSFRSLLQRIYLNWCHSKLMLAIKGEIVLVNSIALMNKLTEIASEVKLIPSSTLTENDFCLADHKIGQGDVKVLYTGRLDLNKGLLEMIHAIHILNEKYNIQLHVVGWEEDTQKPVETILREQIADLKLENHIYLHGKKRVGDELNSMYRMADIYCIPSYHEGFPRTIWEAMANGLPVIATKVGGIPYFLEHKIDSILIEPKSVDAIVFALEELMINENLRNTIRVNGWQKAKLNTVERRSNELIKYLNEVL